MKPIVFVKAAMSLDGKIATKTGESQWISNEASRAYVHGLRAEYAAICVGVKTVIQDDPDHCFNTHTNGRIFRS